MPFVSALSTAAATPDALSRGVLGERIGRTCADLAVAFFSPHHADSAAAIAKELHGRSPADCALIGCIGEAIVGTGREVEHRPALSLWLGNWNGRVEMTPFHLVAAANAGRPEFARRPDELIDSDAADTTLMVLGDPFTFPATEIFLPRMNGEYPGVTGLRRHGLRHGRSGRNAAAPRVRSASSRGRRRPVAWRLGGMRRGVAGVPADRQAVRGDQVQDHHVLELGGRPPLEQLKADL